MNPALKKQIDALETRVNKFSLRERVLLLATLLVVIYFLWYNLVFGVLLVNEAELEQNSKKIVDQITALQGQIDSISEAVGRDPTSSLLKRAKELKQENSLIQDKISLQTQKMASPKEMVQVIKRLIAQTKGLTVVSMSSLESKPLFGSKTKKASTQVYSHGLNIEVSGDFFSTLKFLEAAELEQHKMLWDSITYKVEEYPQAITTIYIRTLGLQEGLVGV